MYLRVDLLAPFHSSGQLGVPLVEREGRHVLLLPSLHARLDSRAVDFAPCNDGEVGPLYSSFRGEWESIR